jgi:hypothetical protein
MPFPAYSGTELKNLDYKNVCKKLLSNWPVCMTWCMGVAAKTSCVLYDLVRNNEQTR